MNNLFGQLYLDLSNHLKSAVPSLRWIDQDFGQLEVFEYRPAVAFPCALIDFAQANFSNMAELAQMADLNITIRIGFAPFSAANTLAPMDVREKALEYYNIEQLVYEAVQGWQPSFEGNIYAQPFIRVSSQTEQRLSASGTQDANGLRVRVLLFNTQLEDYTAVTKYASQAAALEVQQEIDLS